MAFGSYFYKSGSQMVFRYSGDKNTAHYRNGFRRADGKVVTIVRPLIEEESPEQDVSSLYIVKCHNGGRMQVFEDELSYR